MRVLTYIILVLLLATSVTAWDGSYRANTALIDHSLPGIYGNPDTVATSLSMGRDGASIRGKTIITTDQRERIVLQYLKIDSRSRSDAVMTYTVQGTIQVKSKKTPTTFTMIMHPAKGTLVIESDDIFVQHTDLERLRR